MMLGLVFLRENGENEDMRKDPSIMTFEEALAELISCEDVDGNNELNNYVLKIIERIDVLTQQEYLQHYSFRPGYHA